MKTSREWCALTVLVVTASAIAVLGIGTAHATEQRIIGKKLLLKKTKFVVLSKDPSITSAGIDLVGGGDSTVSFNDGSGSVGVVLPATRWRAAGTGFKYKDSGVSELVPTVKVAKLADGLLKAVGTFSPVVIPNGPASIDVAFSFAGGAKIYHLTFIGSGDGVKYVTKQEFESCGDNVREGSEQCDGSDATACPDLCLSDCRCPAICGNNIREGYEECDGTDAAACPGLCRSSADALSPCTCGHLCGNNIREGHEDCDGTDDQACPGQCSNCGCPTAPSLAFCCDFGGDLGGACLGGFPNNCIVSGGILGPPGSVCDGVSHHCTAPPGSPGNCCHVPGTPCFYLEPYTCEFNGAISSPGTVCMPNGTCQ